MDWNEIGKMGLNVLLWLTALYVIPNMFVSAVMEAYFKVKRKYPTVNQHNWNVNIGLPGLHLLKAFFHNEGAIGAEHRAEIELGARKAMLAQLAAGLLDEDHIARKDPAGMNHTFGIPYKDFAAIAGEYDPKYRFVERKEQ